jgi:hypothetical protein
LINHEPASRVARRDDRQGVLGVREAEAGRPGYALEVDRSVWCRNIDSWTNGTRARTSLTG